MPPYNNSNPSSSPAPLRKTLPWAAALFLALASLSLGAAEQGRVIAGASHVLELRARVAVENEVLEERLQSLLPELMQDSGLDMWLVIAREYADDPVYASLVPVPSFTARRTTMLVFQRLPDGSIKRLTVSRYPLGEPYEAAWSGGSLDEQWQALADLIVAEDPQRIGINVSRDWPVADGLTHGLHARLLEVLPPAYQERLESADSLIVRWVETRNAKEIELYSQAVALARGVIAEAFSNQVITPGVTSTDDVAWYLRERFSELNLPVWFMPYVNLQREAEPCTSENPFCGIQGIIRRGDVLHTDVGICYLKLCTDTQEMAYVARLGEQEVPDFLLEALAKGNQWQDNLTENFITGRSGNEILRKTIEDTQRDGIVSSTYTHPIGFFGHAPGPTIGMWDNQGETPVRGDWPVAANTAYAIEGNVKVGTDGWGGGNVHIKLEQSAVFDGQKVIYLAGRQTEWHLVR